MKQRIGFGLLSALSLALSLGACSDASSNHPDGGDGGDGGAPSPLLDTEFGEQGVLRVRSTWSTDAILAAERTADGEFLLGGTTILTGHVSQLLLVRFTAAGQPDPGFGDAGVVLIPLFDLVQVTDLAPLADGSAVLSGTAFTNANIGFVAKVDAQGALDPAFGQGGLTTWDGHFQSNTAVLVLGDGRVLVLSDGVSEAELRRLNADGSPDEGFGSDGLRVLQGEEPREMVHLPDGRILALTAEDDEAFLHRLTPAGDPDTSFADGGTYAVPFLAHDLALSPAGDEILLAGTGAGGNQVQKLDADGAPVTAFGADSLVFVDAAGELLQVEWHENGEIFLLEGFVGNFPHCLFQHVFRLDGAGNLLDFDRSAFSGFSGDIVKRLLSDGSALYLLGSLETSDDTPAHMDSKAAVLAFAPDGTGLSTFGTDGLAAAGSGAGPEVMWHMVAMPDGAVIAAGSAGVNGILARFVDGQQDLDFGTGGFASGYGAQFSSLAPEAAGSILALNWGGGMIRFLADGTHDTGFAADALPGRAHHLALDASGRIVVAGAILGGSVTPFLARYHADGSLDASFGSGGVVQGLDGNNGYALAVHVDAQGRILAAGNTQPPDDFPDTFIARFDQDGSMDPSFGAGGLTVVDGYNYMSRIISRRDGGYLFTAYLASSGTINIFAVDDAGEPIPSFGAAGKVAVEVKGESYHDLLELDDGRILLAESITQDNMGQPAVWCLRPDGTLDPDFDADGLFVYPGQGRAVSLLPDGDGVLVGGQLFSPESGTDLVLLRLIP